MAGHQTLMNSQNTETNLLGLKIDESARKHFKPLIILTMFEQYVLDTIK